MTDETPKDRPALNDGFYRQMLHQAAVAVVATDAQFNIVCWNAAAEELLAARGGEMLGKRTHLAERDGRRKDGERTEKGGQARLLTRGAVPEKRACPPFSSARATEHHFAT